MYSHASKLYLLVIGHQRVIVPIEYGKRATYTEK
jgi:hypothetical protein